MSFQQRTWVNGEFVAAADTNRWEQGIADAAAGGATDPAFAAVIADPVSATRVALASVTLGSKSDAFILRSNADGDQRAQLTAFLADSSLSGERRIIGKALIAGNVPVPAGVRINASKATFEQTNSNAVMFGMGAGSSITGGTFVGKSTDYNPGSGSPLAIGIDIQSAGVKIEGADFIGFGGAAIRASAANSRLRGLNIYGVHGIGGLTIAYMDQACYGIYLGSNTPNTSVEGVYMQDLSIGMIASYDAFDLSVRGCRAAWIRGQHAFYLQTGTGLLVSDVAAHDVALNAMKVQMGVSEPADSYGLNIGRVTGRDIGDTVLALNNTALDLNGAKKFYGSTISGISGTNALRVLYLGSLRGAAVSNVSGYNTGADVLNILDCQDLNVAGVQSVESGKVGVRFTNSAALSGSNVGSATQRVTLRDVSVRNPGNTGVAGDGYALVLVGNATDGVDVTVDGFTATADNGKMISAIALSSASSQETFRLRNARVRDYTVAPFTLASSTRTVGEWGNVDTGSIANYINYPTTLPTRSGGLGDRTTYVASAIPTMGVFRQGDVVYNSAPAAAGVPSWVAIGSGGAHGGSWVTATAYAVGAWRRQSAGKVFECIVAGTSGATEPTATVLGTMVADGTVTWAYRAAALTAFKASAAISA